MTQNDDRKALELLLFDPDLETLEGLLAEFNIFEAIGAVRQELRHSDFLAFLLNPGANHGLSDTLLKRLLRQAVLDGQETAISAIELNLADMSDAVVLREWRNIDILIDDYEHNKLVCLIENKIFSGEHSNQLQRYLDIVERSYPGTRVLLVFLTPEGDLPSDERYLPLSYDTVADVLVALLETQSSTLGPDVRTLIAHYVHMLRRHIVSDSEIADLCWKIYRRHQRALDLLFEYRPDLQSEIADYLVALVEQEPELVLFHTGKGSVTFIPAQWQATLQLDDDSQVLLFEFVNRADKLDLFLYIGPGPAAQREALFAHVNQHRDIFRNRSRALTSAWTHIHKVEILKAKDYNDASLEDLTAKIDKGWQHFLERELPAIDQHILQIGAVFPAVFPAEPDDE